MEAHSNDASIPAIETIEALSSDVAGLEFLLKARADALAAREAALKDLASAEEEQKTARSELGKIKEDIAAATKGLHAMNDEIEDIPKYITAAVCKLKEAKKDLEAAEEEAMQMANALKEPAATTEDADATVKAWDKLVNSRLMISELYEKIVNASGRIAREAQAVSAPRLDHAYWQ